jgi:hypothetical protein
VGKRGGAADHDPSIWSDHRSTCSCGDDDAGAKREERENVLRLVMNLADPSGGIGGRNRERAPFAERVRPDVTLPLALVHYLAIGANVPLPEVVEWLGGIRTMYLAEPKP